jgi:hypothetical protein
MSGKIIFSDGSTQTTPSPHVIKIEGDSVYVNGEPFPTPQHTRVIFVFGDSDIVSVSNADRLVIFGNANEVRLTTGSVIVNGTVSGDVRVNGGTVTINDVEVKNHM